MENGTTEYKREYVEDVKNTVAAFANCDGGTLYIGIEDDGAVCGVEDPDGTMLRVSNALRDAIRPDVTMFTDYRAETREGKTVLCVTVQRGTARPYYLRGKGLRPEGVFLRQGASTVPATEQAIRRMIRETGGDSFEEVRSLNQQLSFETATAFFAKRQLPLGEAQMRTLHLIGRDGTYSNLALLLSDQCTQAIKLAAFEGAKKTVFKDRLELSGSILGQLEEAYAYIERYNRTRAEFNGLDRVDIRDYPPEALREALLNAIVHRDYSFSGSTLISIFEDRIEFVTIGGLVEGITLKDVKLGVSVLRNQYLANIFYRLRLIEAYGTGILKIREAYAGCPVQPMLEATDNAFKLTLPNLNYRGEAGHRAAENARSAEAEPGRAGEVLTLCREKGSLTRAEVETALRVSQSTAILLLRKMIGAGLLRREGRGKETRYYAEE